MTHIPVSNGLDSPTVLRIVVIPDSDCMELLVNQRYHLRGPVLPRTDTGHTYFYPTARSAFLVECHEPTSLEPASSTVVSRGRVIQCRNQRSHSRWWVNVLHTVYNQDVSACSCTSPQLILIINNSHVDMSTSKSITTSAGL